MSDAPVMRVVAGPGSGKTTGLRRRVQRLIEGAGVDPERIFVTDPNAVVVAFESERPLLAITTSGEDRMVILEGVEPYLAASRERFFAP